MYYYFSSNYPSALKLNGIYYGAIHNAVKNCNVNGEELPFIEVCPIDGKEKPLAFIPDNGFLTRPPERVIVTDMDGGYTLNFLSEHLTQEFKVFAQQRFSDAVITVFSENGYKLSIETKNDFYAESIAFEFSSADIIRNDKYKNLITVYLYGEKTLVFVYDITGRITKIFNREVQTAEFNDSLITVEPLCDMAKHKITTEWQYEKARFSAISKRIVAQNPLDISRLNEKVIPFAFLEELLIGGEYLDFLCPDIAKNADKLKGFFGEFIGVMPPPIFKSVDQVGLIYQKSKNTYKVEYFKFKVAKKKIVEMFKC